SRSTPRFLCDVMLGRLARWLRALGHNAADDPALLRRAAQQSFRACPGCGRVYWPGTHRPGILAALESALPGVTSSDLRSEPPCSRGFPQVLSVANPGGVDYEEAYRRFPVHGSFNGIDRSDAGDRARR
ncbi:MAG: Mut7-C RNAse domain-containing protein, partial [Hyphomicrobium sp.]|nr:Mut7-C RNAse domain-containing protein [Hyphomicrobium sp.]